LVRLSTLRLRTTAATINSKKKNSVKKSQQQRRLSAKRRMKRRKKKRSEFAKKACLICSKQRMQVNQFSNNEKIFEPFLVMITL